VDVYGRLGFLEVGLRQHLDKLLNEGHHGFVLNLANVPYIDSFGLGQLVTVWNSIQRTGGRMVLLRPTDHVRQLLRLTKLDSVFDVLEEENEALGRARLKVPAPA
jgi:anti-sigma B factor antagonist